MEGPLGKIREQLHTIARENRREIPAKVELHPFQWANIVDMLRASEIPEFKGNHTHLCGLDFYENDKVPQDEIWIEDRNGQRMVTIVGLRS